MRRVCVASALVIAAAVLAGDARTAQAKVLERSEAARSAAAARGPQRGRASGAPDVHVLQRQLVGRYIEDVDYVPNGHFGKHIVMLNGQEVHGFKLKPNSTDPIHKLFDLRDQVLLNPTGIAYLASERSFAVVGGLSVPAPLHR